MERGQLIRIRAYPDKELERVVLEVKDTYVLVCRPEVYPEIAGADSLPDCVMGFPKEDVIVAEGKTTCPA